jgi:Zn-dependent protease
VPLFTFRGIQVQAHWSVAFPLVGYAGFLGSSRYLGRYPQLSTTTITAMTVVSLLLIPVSIILHEFGHSFQARREGLHADRITLWGLGGISWSSGPRSAGADFRMVAAGPSVTVVLVVLGAVLAWLAKGAGLPTAVTGVVILFWQFNAAMLAFNLLPMVPLDGGRLLNAGLWRLRGVAFARTWVCRLGVVIALTVIAVGAVAPFLITLNTPARFSPGLAIMFWGVIMLWETLAYASAVRVRPRRRQWSELLVGDLMEGAVPGDAPASGVTIARFLEDAASPPPGYGTAAFPVLEDGRAVGLISRGLAGRVPADQHEGTAIGDVMLRKEDAVVLRRETTIAEAFRLLQDASRQHGVILDRGRVTAIILKSDLAHVLLAAKDAARGVVDR